MRTLLVALTLAAALAGCRKPQPSLEYLEASGSYSTLVARDGDEAYASEEMARIEQVLSSVPAASADAAAAKALLEEIAKEKRRIADELSQAQREREALERAPEFSDAPQPDRAPPSEPTAEPEDAGAPEAGPQVGMTVATLTEKFGECFRPGDSVVMGSGETAIAWPRVAAGDCVRRFPSFAARAPLVRAGAVVRITELSGLQRLEPKPTLRDGGFTTTEIVERQGIFGLPPMFVTDGGEVP